jgi:Polyketide synthase modules and related proteins
MPYVKKTKDQIKAVLAPKVRGTIILDKATKGEELDFMVLFSSLAGVVGNIGQCDYAGANAFLDAFAEYRQKLIEDGERFGKTVSIGWPLWKEGGMRVDTLLEKRMKNTAGIELLETAQGVEAFEDILKMDELQVLVIDGDKEKIRKALGMEWKPMQTEALRQVALGDEELEERVQKEIIESVSDVLRIGAEEIDVETDMAEYGVDSIMMMQMMDKMEEAYGEALPPSVIMEYPTIRSLAKYLIESGVIKSGQQKKSADEQQQGRKARQDVLASNSSGGNIGAFHSRFTRMKTPIKRGDNKIAVISMAGRFPKSRTIEEFWERLKEGMDCITEVPTERFEIENYYSSDKGSVDKTYTKRAGLIDDIDLFDAEFFGNNKGRRHLSWTLSSGYCWR